MTAGLDLHPISRLQLPTPPSDHQDATENNKRTAGVLEDLTNDTAVNVDENVSSNSSNSSGRLAEENDAVQRVRVDRAGRSPEDRKLMDDHIYQVWAYLVCA